MERFKGKIVLITGAAQGVGKKTAELFASEGADIYISDLNYELLKELENSISKKGSRVKAAKIDISKISEVGHMVEDAFSMSGRIDFLVNNAGVSMTKKMMELNEEDWDKVLNVNVKGTFFVLREAAQKMISKGNEGCIINVASIAGEKGRPNFLAYAASKAALINITMSAALEFAKYGIRVNAVAPGTIDTPMWGQIAAKISEIDNVEKEKLVKNWVEKIPLKRLAKPEDIANTILYLCSDEAKYITAQTINVCGGLSVT